MSDGRDSGLAPSTGRWRVIAIDGGRTGCRARRRDHDGTTTEATGPGLAPLGPDADPAASVAAVLRRLLEPGADAVVAGLAGAMEDRRHHDAVAAAISDITGARRIVVTGDLLTSHAGALGGAPGAVVAAGTGAVALAVDADGRSARVDGWGHLLGDDGSGWWIGRAGLASALAHHDGRGGSAILAAAAETSFGPLDDLAGTVHSAQHPVERIAAFARPVAAAAQQGDEVSRGIWDRAGRVLAGSLIAAATRVDDVGAASWTGGLFAAGPLLLDPLTDEVRRVAPHLVLRPPLGDALDGGLALAVVPAHLGRLATITDR